MTARPKTQCHSHDISLPGFSLITVLPPLVFTLYFDKCFAASSVSEDLFNLYLL